MRWRKTLSSEYKTKYFGNKFVGPPTLTKEWRTFRIAPYALTFKYCVTRRYQYWCLRVSVKLPASPRIRSSSSCCNLLCEHCGYRHCWEKNVRFLALSFKAPCLCVLMTPLLCTHRKPRRCLAAICCIVCFIHCVSLIVMLHSFEEEFSRLHLYWRRGSATLLHHV